ncbi:cyclin-dependent kinase 9-A-like [Cotesia typhae]|uniref:cyclin-dependent kinase 9-A-like n=1 Tax=Cotesia typhae TaxID=2053667 RepID=UPI003D68EE9A
MSSDDEIDKYERLVKIGQGAFAEVFIVKNRTTNKLFTMKISIQSDIEVLNDPIVVREAKILRTLEHWNVIKLIDYSSYPEKSLLLNRESSSALSITEFCPFSLSKLIVNPEFHFEELEIKSIVWQLILGLDYLHEKGLVHGDLRPSNILMTKTGAVKLSDFGLATYLDLPYLLSIPPVDHNWNLPSPAMWYAPPEELLGRGYHGIAADTWRLGCIIPEMWTKKPIMKGSNRIEQLVQIFELCGSVQLESWPDVESYPFFDKTILPMDCRRQLSTRLKSEINDEKIVTMIDEMLIINPIFRLPSSKTLDWLSFINREDFQPWLFTPMLDRYMNCNEAELPHLGLQEVNR